MNNDLKHFGVKGMQWGRRKVRDSIIRLKSVRQKRLDAVAAKKREKIIELINKRKIKTKEDIHNISKEQIDSLINSPAMQRKIKNYNLRENRKKIETASVLVGLGIIAISTFAPQVIRAGNKAYWYARQQRYDDLLNRYGGHAAEQVINSRFV